MSDASPSRMILENRAEPLPTRIAALALGTGDVDCVYHFALPELQNTLKEINNEDQLDILTSMVEGKRLRDISAYLLTWPFKAPKLS